MVTSAEPAQLAQSLTVDREAPYVFDQPPALLSWAAAASGWAPPSPRGGFVYADIGCATGVTLNTLAAANPEATFIGVDEPLPVAVARAEAGAAGLGNVRYVERAIGDLRDGDLPEADYLAIHSSWSWLAPEAAARLLAFAARASKPGGLLYLETISLPGMAAIEPVWTLLRELAAEQDLADAERTARALDLLGEIQRAGAHYFGANPVSGTTVEQLVRSGERLPPFVRDAVRESMRSSCRPRFFGDLAAELAGAGFSWAASTRLATNDISTCVPPQLRWLFDGVRDPLVVEQLKDYVLMRPDRRDVFVKGSAPDRAAADRHLREAAWVYLRGSADPLRQHVRGAGAFDRVRDALLAAMPGRAVRLADLAPETAPFDPALVLQVLVRLVATGAFFVCAGPNPDASLAETWSMPLAWNRLRLDRDPIDPRGVVMASPVVGAGSVPLNPIEIVLLRSVLDRRSDEECGVAARAGLAALDGEIEVEGRSVSARSVSAADVRAMLERLRANKVPNMRRLGVIGS